MMFLVRILSYAGLVLTLVPATMVLTESIPDIPYQLLATIGMVMWFVTAPFWINKTKKEPPE